MCRSCTSPLQSDKLQDSGRSWAEYAAEGFILVYPVCLIFLILVAQDDMCDDLIIRLILVSL